MNMDLCFVSTLQTSPHICHIPNSYGNFYNSYDMCEVKFCQHFTSFLKLNIFTYFSIIKLQTYYLLKYLNATCVFILCHFNSYQLFKFVCRSLCLSVLQDFFCCDKAPRANASWRGKVFCQLLVSYYSLSLGEARAGIETE